MRYQVSRKMTAMMETEAEKGVATVRVGIMFAFRFLPTSRPKTQATDKASPLKERRIRRGSALTVPVAIAVAHPSLRLM